MDVLCVHNTDIEPVHVRDTREAVVHVVRADLNTKRVVQQEQTEGRPGMVPQITMESCFEKGEVQNGWQHRTARQDDEEGQLEIRERTTLCSANLHAASNLPTSPRFDTTNERKQGSVDRHKLVRKITWVRLFWKITLFTRLLLLALLSYRFFDFFGCSFPVQQANLVPLE